MIENITFIISTLFWWVAEPGAALVSVAAFGAVLLATRWQRLGRRLVMASLGLLLVLSVLPVGPWLLGQLEDRFAPPQLGAEVGGIVVLGGGIEPELSAAHGQSILNGSAERLTALVELARRYPGAPLIFSGGARALVVDPETSEARAAQRFFTDMGVDVGRIRFEETSRNTFENAVNSFKLLNEDERSRDWVLVTSAAHMPRAVGVFRRAGWRVVPYPVDYLVPPPAGRTFQLGRVGQVGALSHALREVAGLALYRLKGRTDSWFPGPQPPGE